MANPVASRDLCPSGNSSPPADRYPAGGITASYPFAPVRAETGPRIYLMVCAREYDTMNARRERSKRMKRLVIGMLAHVDAGKTTLSEGLLYQSGALRRLGRVDHGDAFLDTHAIERARGITIFSKQALLEADGARITLLDTPGHVDFSAETERALQVMDYAVLVVSATDGVQAHTRTLWRLLRRFQVPVFLFVNKMDLPGAEKAAILSRLRSELDGNCIDFTQDAAAIQDSAAMCAESLMEAYLARGSLTDGELADAILARQLFPVLFGSALRMEGVDRLLGALARYTQSPQYPDSFGARVFKITHEGGVRLTWMKITGGRLRAKALLTNRRASLDADAVWQEKADQIRLYSGARFTAVPEAEAGAVCAVTGLTKTFPGEGLGVESGERRPLLEPVLTYRVLLPDGTNPVDAVQKLRSLQEEDPELSLVWDGQRHELHVRLMGEVQREVVQALIAERFGLSVAFGPATVLYRETIAAPAEGVGHYEPLRHYAHVQLLLEPLERGSGLVFETACGEDRLARSWQRLILTHLGEKQHLGVLTGSPVTDLRITLIDGRAHQKHTEGGDFRQATYRAVRQGLMRAESVLLEPYYAFRLELPADHLGRAMADIRRMDGAFEAPAVPSGASGRAVLEGSAPVAAIGGYAREVAAYTRGEGRLTLTPNGYRPCRNAGAVIAAIGYDPESDVENTPDSVFCSHGAGYTVKWNAVQEAPVQAAPAAEPPRRSRTAAPDEEEALKAIYERTYGPVRDRALLLRRRPEPPIDTSAMLDSMRPEETYLLVDGYNILFAWDDLSALARQNLSLARETLIRLLIDYQGCRGGNLILVFDAYRVSGGEERVEQAGGIYIVYTREAEIADVYIERVTQRLRRQTGLVRVATSDGLEQLIVLGRGALRVPARAFREEVDRAGLELREIMASLRAAARSEAKQAYSIGARLRGSRQETEANE